MKYNKKNKLDFRHSDTLTNKVKNVDILSYNFSIFLLLKLSLKSIFLTTFNFSYYFRWMVKLCKKGVKKSLEICDLYKPLTSDESERLTNALEQNWEAEKNRCKDKLESGPSLFRAIVKTFFWSYMFYGILLFLQVMFKSILPLVLAYFIKLFSYKQHNNNYQDMILFGLILAVFPYFIAILTHHSEFGQSIVGMRARVAVSSLVYRKVNDKKEDNVKVLSFLVAET